MDKKKRCETCEGVFEPLHVVFEVAETDFVFTQSHCDACIDEIECRPASATRIKLEDIMEVLNESL